MNKFKSGTITIALAGVILLGLINIVPEVNAQVLNTLEEPFDDYDAGVYPPTPVLNRPSDEWDYLITGTSSNEVDLVSSPALAGQSLRTGSASQGGGSLAAFQTPNIEFNDSLDYPCDGSSEQIFEFDYRTTAFPTQTTTPASRTVYMEVGSTVDGSDWRVDVGDTGTLTAEIQTSTGTTHSVTVSGGAITINEWWHITLSSFNCDEESFTVTKQRTADGTGFGVANVNGASLSGVMSPPTQFFSVISLQGSSVGFQYYENFNLEGFDIPPPIIDVVASATVAVTGLTGFDHTLDGGYVIARTNSGDFIRVYTGESLTAGFSEDVNCLMSNGVVALGNDGFTYFGCGGTTPDRLEFIDVGGTPYPFDCIAEGEVCSSHDGVIDLLPISDQEQFFNDIVDLSNGEIKTHASNDDGEEAIIHEFVFGISGTTGGKIYALDVAFAYLDSDGTPIYTEPNDFAQLTYATTALQDICSNNALKAYVIDELSQTKGYTATINPDIDSSIFTFSSGDVDLDVTLSNTFTAPSQLSNADDISCSSSSIIVNELGGTDSVHLLNVTSGQIEWTIGVTAVDVALSQDGLWAAYSSSADGATYIINVEEIDATCALTHPAGTFVDSGIDRLGQRAWVATATNIAFYPIQESGCTTTESQIPGCAPFCGEGQETTSSSSTSSSQFNDVGDSVVGGGDGHPFGINVTWTAEGLDLPVVGVQVLIGLILMVVFSIWFYKGTGSVVLATLGAALGLIVGTVMGLVPPWVIMAVVFMLIIIVGKMLFGGFNGGEES